ncbi:flagellar biosynthesis protein, partial [Salmonella enterica subsp. enterica serovar Haifa]|nr:flagellar biosynthesis protein [Salmonella enterica subsp. enterica serovar Haifa]
DYDFAMLNRAERDTYMTHPVSNQLSQKYDHPDYRGIFQDKIEFNRRFAAHLHREWLVVEEGNADAVRALTERLGTIVTKEPVGQAGTGVHR